ncbi:MAG TPA: sulfite exporter TauE/SafE family protein [Hyphomicrobiaceae bacterium]|nr:sulfite exporter TauE/SafE family protein [Hyphomicrobiaceae bacterium]
MSIYLPIAEIASDVLILTGLGLIVGFLSGMFGIGGGFIMTPLLIASGVPSAVSVSTGAASVMASGVSGAIAQWKRRNVDVRLGIILLLGGGIGAFIGVRCLTLLRRFGQLDFAVAVLFSVMLGVVGTLMLVESLNTMWKARSGRPVSMKRAGQHAWFERLPLKTRFPTSRIYMSALPPLLLGAFVGLLTGIMGVGGGFITVPALVYLFRAPTKVAVGTSLFQVVFVAGFTTLLHAGVNQTIDVVLAIPIMLGGVVGAQYGARAGARLNAQQLRLLLAIIVLIAAVRMVYGLTVMPVELFAVDAIR